MEGDLKLVIKRGPKERLGLVFEGEENMVLKRVLAGKPGQRAGADRFIGRYLTHVEDQLAENCSVVRKMEHMNPVTLRWAWPLGQPVEVLRSGGKWSQCAVQQVAKNGYTVAGMDDKGVFEKTVPFNDTHIHLRLGAPSKAYTVGQPVEVLRSTGHWSPSVVDKVDDKESHYVVFGSDGGDVFEKRIIFDGIVGKMRPGKVISPIEFTDPASKEAVKLKCCHGVGIALRDTSLRTLTYSCPPGAGSTPVISSDTDKKLTLPAGDRELIARIRAMAEAQGVRHNLPTDAQLANGSVFHGAQPTPELSRLQDTEAEDRDRLWKLQERGERHLVACLRRLHEPFGKVASVGVRAEAEAPLILTEVVKGSAADHGGVKPGDLVLKVGTPMGVWQIFNREQLMTALGPRGHVFEGVKVVFHVVRDPDFKKKWTEAIAKHGLNRGLPQKLRPNASGLPPSTSPSCLPALDGVEVLRLEVTCDGSWKARPTWIQQLKSLESYFPSEPGVNHELICDVYMDPTKGSAFLRQEIDKVLKEKKKISLEDMVKIHQASCATAGIPPGLPEEEIEAPFGDAAAMEDIPEILPETAVPILRELLLEVVFRAEEQGFA